MKLQHNTSQVRRAESGESKTSVDASFPLDIFFVFIQNM